MASQRMTLAKVGGLSASLLEQTIAHLAEAEHPPAIDDLYERKWSTSDRQSIDNLADSIKAHLYEFPVVYSTEWFDTWCMGDVYRSYLTPDLDFSPYRLEGDRHELHALTSAHSSTVARHITKKRRPRFQEETFLRTRLLECINSWGDTIPTFIIILIREPLGSLVCDSELEGLLDKAPSWVEQLPRDKPA